MKKLYLHKNIHMKKSVIVSFLLQLRAWELTVLKERDFILDAFLRNLRSFKKARFHKRLLDDNPDFQHYFGHITCSISNKSA